MTSKAELLASFAAVQEPVDGVPFPFSDPETLASATQGTAQAMSCYLKPLDYEDITLPPTSSWELAGEALKSIFETMTSEDGLKVALGFLEEYIVTKNRNPGDPEAFLLGALEGYSNYIHDQFTEIVDAIKSIWGAVLSLYDLVPILAAIPQDSVLRLWVMHLSDPANGFVDALWVDPAKTANVKQAFEQVQQAYESLAAQGDIDAIMAVEGGEQVLTAIDLSAEFLVEALEFYEFLSKPTEFWERVGEVVFLLAEAVRDSDVCQEMRTAASTDHGLDPATLGEAWGTAAGVLMWEDIHEVATLFLGRARLLSAAVP